MGPFLDARRIWRSNRNDHGNLLELCYRAGILADKEGNVPETASLLQDVTKEVLRYDLADGMRLADSIMMAGNKKLDSLRSELGCIVHHALLATTPDEALEAMGESYSFVVNPVLRGFVVETWRELITALPSHEARDYAEKIVEKNEETIRRVTEAMMPATAWAGLGYPGDFGMLACGLSPHPLVTAAEDFIRKDDGGDYQPPALQHS